MLCVVSMTLTRTIQRTIRELLNVIPDFNLDQSFTESSGDFSTETLTDEGHFCYATYIFALIMIEKSHHRRYSQDAAAID